MKYLLNTFNKIIYKEIMRNKILYFFINIFIRNFMINLVRGATRNREVQGWDDKIIHFFINKIFKLFREYIL